MNQYITNIKVNSLYHLHDFNIPCGQAGSPHLLITGKNGSGKTVLLNAIASYLNLIKEDKEMQFSHFREYRENWIKHLNSATDEQERLSAKNRIEYLDKEINELFGQVELSFNDTAGLIEAYQQEQFIITFYEADRSKNKSNITEPQSPTKPRYNIKGDVKQTATDQFLNFLADLKIQEALARNEQQTADADNIHQWFIGFEQLLRHIYQDEQLTLSFDYRDYSFRINTEGKSFKFTETSDGFSAVLDIVIDLILKMQPQGRLAHSYTKKGIVLIDEIETHLHLELQRIIMPLLTQIFPNIQFIVTTHSPFVLNSMNNAIAFDLEHQKILDDLTDYSYDALAEGYFGVSTGSSYMDMQLDKLHRLLEKESLNEADKQAIRLLTKDFEELPEVASPNIVGEFLQLKCQYADKLKNILAL